jgi:hypothetical protein
MASAVYWGRCMALPSSSLLDRRSLFLPFTLYLVVIYLEDHQLKGFNTLPYVFQAHLSFLR